MQIQKWKLIFREFEVQTFERSLWNICSFSKPKYKSEFVT